MTPDLSTQLATLSRSADRVARARAYADRLAAHRTEVQARLAERQVSGTTDAGPLRSELIEVERQHAQAVAILADVEAEHVRHEADLAAMLGRDGEARAKLKDAQAVREAAHAKADAARDILDRATAHTEAVGAKLASALDQERRHDEAAADRLRAALMDGTAPEPAAEALVRTSAALEDDLRVARATVERLKGEHDARLAALAKADLAVRAAVDGVLLVEAEAVARELTATRAHADALHRRLATYADRVAGDYIPAGGGALARLHPGGWYVRDVPLGATYSRVRQTPVMVAALTGSRPPERGGFNDVVWQGEANAWTAYAASLAADAEAQPQFAEVSAPAPLTSVSSFPVSSDPLLAARNLAARDRASAA